MKTAAVQQIADALLYEGYLLYPYRPSVKNRQRWTFGGLYPMAYTQAQGETEPCIMQTECLLAGNGSATLEVQVRFLHLRLRQVGEISPPLAALPSKGEPPFRLVESLTVGEAHFQPWQEAVERHMTLEPMTLTELTARPRQKSFSLPACRTLEPLRDWRNAIVGVLVREHQPIDCTIEVSAEPVGKGRFAPG